MKKQPIQERSHATVAAILEATAQLLQHTTVDRLTTADIAERAGVSVGSMYQYFESKESIIVTLATDTIAKLSDAVRNTMETASPENVEAAIPPIVDVLLSSHAQHPERIAFLMEHLATHGNVLELEEPSIALESWLGQYFISIAYASEEVTSIRVRIAVHGMSAVLRATIRYAPTDMRSPVFREELIRFLHGMLTVGM